MGCSLTPLTQTCAKVPSAVLVCCRCSWKLKSNFVSGVYAGVIFSPTAIALGSSAIGKVWGQNRFRTLYGSGADPSWAATRFCGRFHQFRYSSSKVSTVVSLVLWGRPVLGCQKVPRSHVSLIRLRSAENDPSCLCCWGILWAYLMESYAILFHYFIANWNVFPARSSCSPAVAIRVLTSSQGM